MLKKYFLSFLIATNFFTISVDAMYTYTNNPRDLLENPMATMIDDERRNRLLHHTGPGLSGRNLHFEASQNPDLRELAWEKWCIVSKKRDIADRVERRVDRIRYKTDWVPKSGFEREFAYYNELIEQKNNEIREFAEQLRYKVIMHGGFFRFDKLLLKLAVHQLHTREEGEELANFFVAHIMYKDAIRYATEETMILRRNASVPVHCMRLVKDLLPIYCIEAPNIDYLIAEEESNY